MDALIKLEYLCLVSKITLEIYNHTGVKNKTLGEFIINLHRESSSLEDFIVKIEKTGSGFPNTFIENLDRLILNLDQNETLKSAQIEQDLSSYKAFPGLLIPETQQAEQDDLELELQSLEEIATKASSKYKSFKSDGKSPDKDCSKEYVFLKDSSNVSDHSDAIQRYNFEMSKIHIEKKREPPWIREKDSFGTDHEQIRDRSRILREKADPEPKLYQIYEGIVKNIKDFGCFVAVKGIEKARDGLVHISNIVSGPRLENPQDAVRFNQRVFVKVINYDKETKKISLSMKDVDQESGQDLNPLNTSATLKNKEDGVYNSIKRSLDPNSDNSRSTPKRLSSPEIWEMKQLIASGVLPASALASYDNDFNDQHQEETKNDLDEDVEIEIREDEPDFLNGQIDQSIELSPIRVVKAPDGSLNRAAMSGTSLAKNRKDERDKQAREKEAEAATKKNIILGWHDPMAKSGSRAFAEDVRSEVRSNTRSKVSEWRLATQDASRQLGKRTNLSIREQRESLPVFKLRDKFIDAIKKNQLLIVVGDTGSGKTTQITQYFVEEGFARYGKIGCTQPRRVAAISVAKRVAEEMGCRLGQEVGYTIRFDDCTSSKTKIKYLTDGMLQMECLVDPDLKQYSIIILDEAHERTIATDVLFGLLKKTLKRRPDLKIIVTSATLDAEKFSSYFYDCPIFSIPGRTFPVEILHSKEPEADYLDAALVTVMQIHLSEPPGDILLFLTGQEEIDTSCEVLYERMKALGSSVPELIILPVYSSLPSEMQSRIFEPAPPGSRKVVIATNIAETSITIDGIYYVVDPGFVKQNCYDPKLGMDSLVVMPISQAQARQRSGRAGRTGPGKCFRLYTESAYKTEMLPNSVPDIQRQNLSHTILMLKALGINDLLKFDFMDAPPKQTLISALENLYALAALDNEGLLTKLGRKMSDFPMEPPLAKVLIASVDLCCSEEVMSIIGMLSVQTVWYRSREKQQQADQRRARLTISDSDHLTLLNVYNSWKKAGSSDSWCFENYIQSRSLKRASDVRKQLEELMARYRHPIISCGRDTERILKAFCSGFFGKIARKDPHEGHYTTIVEGTPVYLHPSSALFGKGGQWVLFHELVMTTKEYMHTVSLVKPQWLVEAAPNFFKKTDPNRISKSKQRDKVVPLFDRNSTGDDWRISKQRSGPQINNQLFKSLA